MASSFHLILFFTFSIFMRVQLMSTIVCEFLYSITLCEKKLSLTPCRDRETERTRKREGATQVQLLHLQPSEYFGLLSPNWFPFSWRLRFLRTLNKILFFHLIFQLQYSLHFYYLFCCNFFPGKQRKTLFY